jgi:hypothetical protein
VLVSAVLHHACGSDVANQHATLSYNLSFNTFPFNAIDMGDKHCYFCTEWPIWAGILHKYGTIERRSQNYELRSRSGGSGEEHKELTPSKRSGALGIDVKRVIGSLR